MQFLGACSDLLCLLVHESSQTTGTWDIQNEWEWKSTLSKSKFFPFKIFSPNFYFRAMTLTQHFLTNRRSVKAMRLLSDQKSLILIRLTLLFRHPTPKFGRVDLVRQFIQKRIGVYWVLTQVSKHFIVFFVVTLSLQNSLS